MVDGGLDPQHPGIGHQTVCRLHAVDAAERGRHPDRAALVAADRHVDLSGRHQSGTAGRRSAGAVAHPVRVVAGAGRVGMAAAREAVVLAMRLAEDRRPGVEEARHDGGVDLRHVALEDRGAVHHRHAGQHDVVLEGDRLALQPAVGRSLDPALVVPGVVFVFLALRPVARRSRVFHLRQVVRHLLLRIRHRCQRRQQLAVLPGFPVGQPDTERAGEILYIPTLWDPELSSACSPVLVFRFGVRSGSVVATRFPPRTVSRRCRRG